MILSPIRIDTHQPRSLGGTEPLQVHLPGRGLQDAEIPGAIEDGQQEQVPRRSGQPSDSRRENRLEAFAEGQGLRCHRALGLVHARECGWKLQERERVALRLREKPLAYPRGERGKAIGQQCGRGCIVERAEVVAAQSAALEEALVP